MNRKNYIKIAEILRDHREPFATTEDELLDKLARAFSDMLAEDNLRFDRGRFLEAAGVIGWKRHLEELAK